MARADRDERLVVVMQLAAGRDEHGHVLVEALIAVLVVAAVTGALFETMGSQAGLARKVAQRRAAMMVAQSQLAGAMIGPGLPVEGDSGDLHWTLQVEPYGGEARSGPLAIERLRVAVADNAAPGRPLVVLQSLRPAP